MAWSRDVDGDGRADLVLHIEAGGLALAPGDTVAHLTGEAPGHLMVRGTARVRVVGGDGGRKAQAQARPTDASAAPDMRVRVLPEGRVVAHVRLAAGDPARVDLFDVSGRRLESVTLEGGVVGEREIALGPRGLAPGVYWVRLEQAGRASTVRVAAVR